MTTSMVTDTNQRVNNGGRRKTKGAEKKIKQPRRGKGVAQLEHERKLGELKNMTQELYPRPLIPSLPFSASGSVHFLPPTVYGPNLYPAVHAMDPYVMKSSNAGFRFENSKDLSSVPNCGSGTCGICHKKKRMNVGSFGQVKGGMSVVDPNGGGLKTEYEFFPGKLGGGVEEFMRLGLTTTTATWCGSGASVAGGLGLRGGEGSCVTAITGSEEGCVSSLDLSLKL